MYQFSDEVEKLLIAHGWSKDRQVPIDEYLEYFEETDQHPSPQILDFLKSFGGIKIDSNEISFIVDTVVGSRSLDITGLISYKRWIAESLVIIGLIFRQDTLVSTADGTMYQIFDSWVARIGDNFIESVENMCTPGSHFQKIEPLDSK